MMRNEADRYLRSALRTWKTFADDILVYDDHSTDATPELLRAEEVWRYEDDSLPIAWGAEAHVRARLFQAALDLTREGDWIFVLDADMVPARNPRPLFEALSDETDALAFPLYDLWSPHHYREDNFWHAHRAPRVWAVRACAGVWEWPERGIHCGHFPRNYPMERIAIAPQDYALLHYGYADAADRNLKAHAYAQESWQLSPAELEHAKSILDPAPRLLHLPFQPELRLIHESWSVES